MNKKLFLVVAISCLLVSCNNQKPKKSEKEDPFINEISSSIEGNSIYTEAQIGYLTNNDPTNTSPYNGNMSVSKPNPVLLTWNGNLDEYQVNIYRNPDMLTDPEEIVVVSGNSYEFYNGQFETTYYWNVSSQDGEVQSEIETFKLSRNVEGPRNLFVDGVENVRDIGGWAKLTEEGGYKYIIKQGMLYRSGRFNEDKEETPKVTVSEDGIYEMAIHFGIKTEVDLRRTSTNEVGGLTDKSVLGDNINYVQLPMIYEGQNILTFEGKSPRGGDDYTYNNPAMIKSFFELLANEDNYPINYHCSIGKDRTGCLSYLVEALMGFDEEMLMRDYMFTNFADAGMCKATDINASNRYGTTLANYENGDNLQEKTYNYLHEIVGVSTQTLNSVISILEVE